MSDPNQWGMPLEAAVCESCDWSYLLPPNSPIQRCPHCYAANLTAVNEAFDQLSFVHPPEMVIPPQVAVDKISAQIERFAKGIPFRPKDLTFNNLSGRIRHTFIPLWLVDSNVQAAWQAEVGFNYQVVSHRERFNQNSNRWQTQQLEETRIRWEPRVGRLNRTYHNQHAPALEDEADMRRRLGDYNLTAAEPYQPQLISQAFVRLPNRPPDDAWPDAEPNFLKIGMAECQKAAEADHIRDYRWSAVFNDRNWTQLLRSVYSTYYLDDAGRPQPVYINGQTGYVSGSRRASINRARRWTFILLAAAFFVFLISVVLAAAGFYWEPAFSLGALGIFVALGAAFLSLIPIFIAWNFNRKPRE